MCAQSKMDIGQKIESSPEILVSDVLERHPTGRFYHPPKIGLGGWVVLSCFAVLLAFVVREFVIQTFRIPSSSMVPTLEVGDHILVSKFWYGVKLPGVDRRLLEFKRPSRGEVIVFYRDQSSAANDTKDYIKRVIGLPGETVQVKNYLAYVNGELVDDEKRIITRGLGDLIDSSHKDFGPLKLKDGEYFVMGDNRVNSQDSRYFGPIRFEDIEGRAFMVYWSWDTTRNPYIIRWERVGEPIR